MRVLARRSKPLPDMTDEVITRRVEEAERTFALLDAEDPATVVRAGRAEENVRRMRESQRVVQAGRAELAARRQSDAVEQMPLRRAFRDSVDARDVGRKAREPVGVALHRVRSLGIANSRASISIRSMLSRLPPRRASASGSARDGVAPSLPSAWRGPAAMKAYRSVSHPPPQSGAAEFVRADQAGGGGEGGVPRCATTTPARQPGARPPAGGCTDSA